MSFGHYKFGPYTRCPECRSMVELPLLEDHGHSPGTCENCGQRFYVMDTGEVRAA